MSRAVIVIAGVGNATGTGAAVAREYIKTHRVALIGRKEHADALAKELRGQSGAEVSG